MLLALAPTARADETLASVARPTPVSAFGGRLAWSSYDAPSGRYFLMTYADGVASRVPVAPRSVPFDADLGPGPGGSTALAYSRCAQAPGGRRSFVGNALTRLPEWRRGRRCDLYRFDFATGRESPIRAASSKHASEFLPTLWKDRLAFARVYDRRAYLYVQRTGHRSRRIPAGARSQGRFCTGKPVRCRRTVEPGPTALDLAGGRLAFGWDSTDDLGPTSSAYLDTIGARTARTQLRIASSGEIQGNEVFQPVLSGGFVWWALTAFGDRTGNAFERFRLGSSHVEEAAFAGETPFGSVLASAVDGSRVYYLRSGPDLGSAAPCAPCDLRVAPLPAFTSPG